MKQPHCHCERSEAIQRLSRLRFLGRDEDCCRMIFLNLLLTFISNILVEIYATLSFEVVNG